MASGDLDGFAEVIRVDEIQRDHRITVRINLATTSHAVGRVAKRARLKFGIFFEPLESPFAHFLSTRFLFCG